MEYQPKTIKLERLKPDEGFLVQQIHYGGLVENVWRRGYWRTLSHCLLETYRLVRRSWREIQAMPDEEYNKFVDALNEPRESKEPRP